MAMVVQIALGIVLAVFVLAILLASKHVRITVIVATILAIPMAILAMRDPSIFESPYIPIVGTFVMVGIVAFGLYVFESLPAWFIKLLESTFWACCTIPLVATLILAPIDEKSVWWAMMAFLIITALMLFYSLRSLRRLLLER